MEDEVIFKQFNEIEKKVERLIGINNSIKKKNTELKDRVEQLEQELQVKIEAENHQTEIKASIRSKLDSLMARLDGNIEA